MKTYYITLNRAVERVKYIEQHVQERQIKHQKISAVDGRLLTPEEIKAACDAKQLERERWWLSDGAIGCALSHKQAYKEFLNTDEKVAFIIEDDVVLPPNINLILEEISQEIKSDEVILLYYTSLEELKISNVKTVKLNKSEQFIRYPMSANQPLSAAAYCVGRDAAQGILDLNTPIKVVADCWSYFYKSKAVTSLRVLYPSPIVTKNFKSSIDYFQDDSLKGWIAGMIDKYKIPFLYQYITQKRANTLEDMLKFSLTEEESPISGV